MNPDLKKRIDLGEGYHLELKETFDKSLIEEVCAFANSAGGKLVLGVTDDGTIKGFKTDNKIRSRIQDSLRQLEPKLAVKCYVARPMAEG